MEADKIASTSVEGLQVPILRNIKALDPHTKLIVYKPKQNVTALQNVVSVGTVASQQEEDEQPPNPEDQGQSSGAGEPAAKSAAKAQPKGQPKAKKAKN